ncbi:hypothetical protein P4B35_18565 [Pontiellaceae bacterium B12227]|nr:hypothetical protein [Pontiellaceae bacterium B12227]
MKAIKQHTIEPNWKQLPYNALHHCLEAHFGTRQSTTTSSHREYREAEQGRRTVPFQSRYPLQLDYMSRRKSDSLIRTAFGFINLKRTIAK